MKIALKSCLIAAALIAVVSLLLYVPVWMDDARARSNRAKVYDLISLEQDLDDAEATLAAAGFQLVYAEPIKPTVNRNYFQQLVVIGETQPNEFESIVYATDCKWVPFTHRESPYVIINADLDGKITEID